MAVEMKKMNQRYVGNLDEYVCDAQSDLASIPKGPKGAPFGSTAYVIGDGTKWMLSSAGVWKQIKLVDD